MGYGTEPRHVKHCRKERACDWCNEYIDRNTRLVTWGWFDNGNGMAISMHVECYDAMSEMHEPGEFNPGENRRGCNCGRSADCERCRINKEKNNAGT